MRNASARPLVHRSVPERPQAGETLVRRPLGVPGEPEEELGALLPLDESHRVVQRLTAGRIELAVTQEVREERLRSLRLHLQGEQLGRLVEVPELPRAERLLDRGERLLSARSRHHLVQEEPVAFVGLGLERREPERGDLGRRDAAVEAGVAQSFDGAEAAARARMGAQRELPMCRYPCARKPALSDAARCALITDA
jgi:hypothetical protein